jgi:hypothetical protein
LAAPGIRVDHSPERCRCVDSLNALVDDEASRRSKKIRFGTGFIFAEHVGNRSRRRSSRDEKGDRRSMMLVASTDRVLAYHAVDGNKIRLASALFEEKSRCSELLFGDILADMPQIRDSRRGSYMQEDKECCDEGDRQSCGPHHPPGDKGELGELTFDVRAILPIDVGAITSLTNGLETE